MFQKAMKFPDIMEEESGCSFYCNHCMCWNEVHSFEDRIHDSHDGIMFRELWEFDHEIDTKHVPPFVWNGEQLELINRRVSLRFCPETEIAGTHILADIPRHLGPLVILGHQF